MNRPRFRHPLFLLEGLHEDNIAPGMRGYRWRRDDGKGQSARGYSELRTAPPYTTRRPVTVVRFARSMETVTLIERREQLSMPVDKRVVRLAPPEVGIFDGTHARIRTDEKVDWLHTIVVRDEENDIELIFGRDPPCRYTNGDLRPAGFEFLDGPRTWRLKLGEFRDDRFEQVHSEEEEQANA